MGLFPTAQWLRIALAKRALVNVAELMQYRYPKDSLPFFWLPIAQRNAYRFQPFPYRESMN